ncbi:uncharacterized protein LOC129589996 [Paramacrobiotus metropolitanus]|uniref:uncharacterized protein LOC129589996 n=1 Tax=Paramacrobiotus metropolitanus TaxID=2943436 RepID=UPI002446206B|nr:uncharacterized protein LOC129589996 [Paramacrobiotus metropolitanus]XP_055340916.1 uncharacterized protein LOC129589996 [Paramacrobiotus metropolitanus]XP_055340917.1 uncharacterized protein LOC129589996 [Paramacrobiotus metropolitanus]XP_055340918.1 uncharacterized protein LOC129589996 [Paramacrobiotus metropolitanus]
MRTLWAIFVTFIPLFDRGVRCQSVAPPTCLACVATNDTALELSIRLSDVETLTSRDPDRPQLTKADANLFINRDFRNFLTGYENAGSMTLCTENAVTPRSVRCIVERYGCATVMYNRTVMARGCMNIIRYFRERATFNATTRKSIYSCWYADDAKKIELCACEDKANCNDQGVMPKEEPVFTKGGGQSVLLVRCTLFSLLMYSTVLQICNMLCAGLLF